MKVFFILLGLLLLYPSSNYAADITLDPVETMGDEYIYPEPNGYNNSDVHITYNGIDDNFRAIINASGLKPGFTYQVKLSGIPSCSGGDDETNEKIGYSGRWTSEGSNRNDAYYEANKALPDDDANKKCIAGYLVFSYFVADQGGEVTLDVETDASYHVLWCGSGVGSNAYLYPGYTPEGSYCPVGKYCTDDDITPEIERSDFRYLPNGNYLNIGISLTEESFHQNCGTWRTVLEGSLSFEIYGAPDPIPTPAATPTAIPQPTHGCAYDAKGSYDMLLMILLVCGLFYGRNAIWSR